MRIRKNAKISPLIYATSYLPLWSSIPTYICKLNQSPWDVMSFSPPSTPPSSPPHSLLQVNKNEHLETNDNTPSSILVVKREEFDDFMWKPERDYSERGGGIDNKSEQVEDKTVIFCSRTNGKRWKCENEAFPGSAMCEHHLSQAQKYASSSAHNVTKKQVMPGKGASRCSRPKKASTSSSLNPNDLYYSSGFETSWAKKKGKFDNVSGSPKNLEREHEVKASPHQLVDKYFEDSSEDEDMQEKGKKRARKLMKTRSLKSLM